MADISDIADYLVRKATAAIYPGGVGQPSVANMDVRLYQGWPLPDQLDADVGGWVLVGTPPVKQKRTNGRVINVSVYPMQGATAEPYQIQDKTYVITPAAINLAITVANNKITVTGTPAAGEFVTIGVNYHNYSRAGANVPNIMAALLADIQGAGIAAIGDASSITLPNTIYGLVVRQGGVGVLGRATHRQKHMVMITTWAPNDTTRRTIAAAIDVALKDVVTDIMVDGSMAKFCYSRSNQTDEQQLQTIYRRDLIYECEYATVTSFPGVTVTTIDIQFQGGNWGLPSPPPQVDYIA